MVLLEVPVVKEPWAGGSPREVWAEQGQAALVASSGCKLTARFPVVLNQTGDWLGSRVVTSGLGPLV